MFDVVGIDTPCMDMLVHLKKLPKPNESGPVLGNSWQGGGKVATGVVASARLGASVAILGAVGDDVYGDFCIADFVRHGIDVSGMKKKADYKTALSIVLSDEETRGRNILYNPRGKRIKIEMEDIDFDMIKQAKILHLASVTDVTMAAAKVAKENGVKVLYDADGYSEELKNMLPYIDILIASEFVYDTLFDNDHYEENLKESMTWGPEVVIYTLGGKGCVGMWEDHYFAEPTFDVTVVDTVGAGDVFHGAYVFGMTQGWNPQEIARFSNAVSSIKCTRIGGRAGIPTLQNVLNFMKTGEIDNEELDQRVEFYSEFRSE